jgi:hypothetical protein
MKSEYIAISTGMKQLLFQRRIYKDLCVGLAIPFAEKSFVSTIFEDNQACLKLATNTDPPRLTPRSQSIAVKYHYFRSHLKKGEIEIKYIETKSQRANILTKMLVKALFHFERLMLMDF